MSNSIMDFIEENYEALLTFAVRITGNWADGEDVLQTVAEKICSKQDTLEDPVNRKSYLMTCIRNSALNLYRANAKQRTVVLDYEIVDDVVPDENAERAFEMLEWVETLNQHLQRYDEPSRKAFIAYYIDQIPLDEAAAMLGLTKRQTIKKFGYMRKHLKEHHKQLFVQLNILMTL